MLAAIIDVAAACDVPGLLAGVLPAGRLLLMNGKNPSQYFMNENAAMAKICYFELLLWSKVRIKERDLT